MGYALVVLIIVLTALAFYVSKRWTGSKHYEMLGRGHVTSRETDAKLGHAGYHLSLYRWIDVDGVGCHTSVSSLFP